MLLATFVSLLSIAVVVVQSRDCCDITAITAAPRCAVQGVNKVRPGVVYAAVID